MKNELINNGKYTNYTKQRFENYKNGLDNETLINFDNLSEEEFVECCKIYNNNHKRRYNGMNYITKMLFIKYYLKNKPKLVFITLTFNDKDLQASEDTRRQRVRRFLNKNCIHYQANIDFGDKNGREHYHAYALIDNKIDLKSWGRDIKVQTIGITPKDVKSAKNYVLKINNHSYKDSTRLKSIIRDRNNSELMQKLDNDLKSVYQLFKSSIMYDHMITYEDLKYCIKERNLY